MKLNMKLNRNKKIIISMIGGLVICIFILYLLNVFSNKESFIPNITLAPVTYTASTVTQLNDYNTKAKDSGKPQTLSVEDLQKIGVPENSVKQFISTGKWPWRPEFIDTMKQIFMNASDNNGNTTTSYSDTITQYQSSIPEEYFVLFSLGSFAGPFSDVARTKKLACNIDSTTRKAIGNGMYTLDGSGNITTTLVDNAQLPKLIPGFTFLSTPCNPCNIINGNYDCPFAYPDSNGKTLFPGFLTEYGWGIYPYSKSNTNSIINNPIITTNTTTNTSTSFSNLLNKFL